MVYIHIIGTNAELVYILPDGIAENKFTLEAKSGDIITNAVLDREEQDEWFITGEYCTASY